MNKELNIVIKNHPNTRSYNWLGGCDDIKSHNWVHCNIKFIASPECYAPIKDAFSSPKAFEILCWDANDKETASISRWTLRDSPVAKQEGDSLWLSFECLDKMPNKFFNYLSNKFHIKIRVSYCPPYKTSKWEVAMYEPI